MHSEFRTSLLCFCVINTPKNLAGQVNKWIDFSSTFFFSDIGLFWETIIRNGSFKKKNVKFSEALSSLHGERKNKQTENCLFSDIKSIQSSWTCEH